MTITKARVWNKTNQAVEAGKLTFPARQAEQQAVVLTIEASEPLWWEIKTDDRLGFEILEDGPVSMTEGPEQPEVVEAQRAEILGIQEPAIIANEGWTRDRVTDNAKVHANQLGVHLSEVVPTGHDGEITNDDIIRYVASLHDKEPTVYPYGEDEHTADIRAGAVTVSGFEAQARPGQGDVPAQGGTGKPAQEGHSIEGVEVDDQGRRVDLPYGGAVDPIAAEDDREPEVTPDPEYVKGVVTDPSDPIGTKITEYASGDNTRTAGSELPEEQGANRERFEETGYDERDEKDQTIEWVDVSGDVHQANVQHLTHDGVHPSYEESAAEQGVELVEIEEEEASGSQEGREQEADRTQAAQASESETQAEGGGDEDEPDSGSAEPEASPKAKEEAERLGVDLREVEGTGAKGNIKVDDVRRHAREQQEEEG